jgi:hypothetical protein
LHFGGDDEQSLELVGNAGVLKIGLYTLDQLLIAIEAGGGDKAMYGLAEVAVVEIRE